MPPDVFLILASSGLTLVAALMFFVSEEPEPVEPPVDPKTLVSFCLPPARKQRVSANPPPLPAAFCAVNVSTASLHGVMTLKPVGDEWVVTLDTAPVGDTPASQVHGAREAYGSVHDLRWHGRAGVAKATTRTWKQKPGRA